MMKKLLDFASWLHFRARAKPIGDAILPLFKRKQAVLDIGCYDGVLSQYLSEKLNLKVEGVDIKLPKNVHIKAKIYNGVKLPFKDKQFDCAMLVDVLHHSENLLELLKEARRVSKKAVVVKDLYAENSLDFAANIMFDLAGVLVGMKLPHKYPSKKEWANIAKSAGFKVSYLDYKFKINFLDSEKHIIMLLTK